MTRYRLPLLTAACGALLACGGLSSTEAPAGDPLVVGPLESIDHRATASRLVVQAAPGSREMCGIAATVDADTRYLRRNGGRVDPAAVSDLQVGDTVEVYVAGPVAESCPVQGKADLVVIRR